MVTGTYALADCPIVALSFGDMVSLSYEIEFNVEIIFKILKQRSKFVITSNASDIIICFIVISSNNTETFIKAFLCTRL